MKNKSVPFSAEEIQDALSDAKYLEELREIERDYEGRMRTIKWWIALGTGLVATVVFLKMVVL